MTLKNELHDFISKLDTLEKSMQDRLKKYKYASYLEDSYGRHLEHADDIYGGFSQEYDDAMRELAQFVIDNIDNIQFNDEEAGR